MNLWSLKIADFLRVNQAINWMDLGGKRTLGRANMNLKEERLTVKVQVKLSWHDWKTVSKKNSRWPYSCPTLLTSRALEVVLGKLEYGVIIDHKKNLQ